MAGSRQHFLPRFLKKGFSSKVRKNEYYTWVFTKDGAPYEANLRNIGLEKDFYGKSEESSVDEKITQQEGVFSEQLVNVRSIDKSCSLESEFPVEFIIHIVFRAKHIRQTMQVAGTTLVDAARKKIDTPETLSLMMQHLIETKPELIMESLDRELKRFLPPNFPKHKKEELIRFALSDLPHTLPNAAAEGQVAFSRLFQNVIERMPEITKNAHVDALSKEVSIEKWGELFKGFSWSLNVTKEPTFILGDIGPIFRHGPCLTFKPLIFSPGKIAQVYLPISDTQMIVGISNSEVQISNSDEINYACAALSQDYFISSKCSEKEVGLANCISCDSSNITSDQLSKIDEIFENDWFGR
jgi:hypothetical protein